MRSHGYLGTFLALLASLSAGACGGGSSSPPPVVHLVTLLVAAPGSPFAPGAPVTLEVTLRNDGNVATQVTNALVGALRITAAMRDASPVPLLTSNSDPEEDLDLVLSGGLLTLAPGQSLTVTLRSRNDSLVGGQALEVLRPGTPVASDVLDLHLAGAYEVTLVYDYDGPVPAGSTVFTSPTAPATVLFTVSP